MRIKLQFTRTSRNRMLPMDYQYALSSWVYKTIGTANAEFSKFLHDDGYKVGHKTFKFFTISELNLYPFKVWKEQKLFELKGNTFSVQIAFMIDEAAQEFIKGLFMRQKGFIGNRFNGIDFEVTGVTVLTKPIFLETMQYKTISPVFLTAKDENERILHLDPEKNKDIYAKYALNNLQQKQKHLQFHDFMEENIQENEMSFKVVKRLGSRLFRINPMTERETRNKMFLYTFELTAPIEIHEILYNAGLGVDSSMGCGMVEVLKE
ncbi:CRISPR-associated endoribonuclease Cas6 [Aureivirga sp. CE67]|uniref:CRISPR-associated endoribonuclease Cas6 n=1 Tax=Aureivirga sp. CE67 TaxID=1788983 RepID=UPI0018CA25E4|nr:CRISPR-associated endoribonuclease Cas6 [Aureivirga sp. CE67]